MTPVLLSVLAASLLLSAQCERHSLTYIYTALSKKVENPGIHQFTAMGLLDTKMIDYFDSARQKKVPKKDWMVENLPEDYWTKGTESRKSKMQWFQVNLGILKDRMNQTDDDIHVLQWMHGCEAELKSDETAPSGKSLVFQRGIDQYSYDGNNFLYFDDANEVWVAASTEAEPTKRKWDDVQVLKDYTKGYLEKECLDWLGKFMESGKAQLQNAARPDVYMFARPSKHKFSVVLTCMATGFYPPDIVLNIVRNGRALTKADGVLTTGIRPNEDDTFQRRDRIEILRTDTAEYICEVSHAASNFSIRKLWDHFLPEHDDYVGGVPVGAVVGAVLAPLLYVLVILGGVLLFRKYKGHFLPEHIDYVGRVPVEVVVGGVLALPLIGLVILGVVLCYLKRLAKKSHTAKKSYTGVSTGSPSSSPSSSSSSSSSDSINQKGSDEEKVPLNKGEDSGVESGGGSTESVPVPTNERVPVPPNERVPLTARSVPDLTLSNERVPLTTKSVPDLTQNNERVPLTTKSVPDLTQNNERVPVPPNEHVPVPVRTQSVSDLTTSVPVLTKSVPVPPNERIPVPNKESVPVQVLTNQERRSVSFNQRARPSSSSNQERPSSNQ